MVRCKCGDETKGGTMGVGDRERTREENKEKKAQKYNVLRERSMREEKIEVRFIYFLLPKQTCQKKFHFFPDDFCLFVLLLRPLFHAVPFHLTRRSRRLIARGGS